MHYIIRIFLCHSLGPYYFLCITLNYMWIWYSDNNKQVLMPVLNMIISGRPTFGAGHVCAKFGCQQSASIQQ